MAKRNPGFYEECSAALYCILALMKREMSADYCPSSKLKLIQPALTYIKQNYTMETISVSHLAALCGISEVYLRKIFSGMFAVSPLQYVNQLKITRAKELLSSGLYSVAEAAEMSGFFDLSYFSREFKKATSLSPSEFKKGNHLSNM